MHQSIDSLASPAAEPVAIDNIDSNSDTEEEEERLIDCRYHSAGIDI